MKERLTYNFVKFYKPTTKRVIIYDIALPSLALFVTPKFINKSNKISGGHKSFYYIYRMPNCEKKQLYIGSFPDMSPNQAR